MITSHLALIPQIPGQGSIHLRSLHARFVEQSELTVHSGRQAGGVPMKVGKQLHIAWSFDTRHWLLRPQGEGTHGSVGFAINET